MRRLLRIRDARVFLAGWGLSMFGDSAMFLVLGIWAKDLTGSNSAAGLVFFVLVLPSLFSPFAGLVVDRVRKRPLLIAVNCIMGVAILCSGQGSMRPSAAARWRSRTHSRSPAWR